MTDFPAPAIDEMSTPYWDGLRAGVLKYQRCLACFHAWLPPRSECPSCLSADWAWSASRGDASVVSWVTYHRSYHPYFADKLPYTVTLVELAEGPRLLTNVRLESDQQLAVDAAVRLSIEEEGGVALARFRLVPEQTAPPQ